VLHSVSVGTKGSDIDHVVIGPGGVVDGQPQATSPEEHLGRSQQRAGRRPRRPYLRNSRHEAERASRLLTEGLASRSS
jgi:hypothetical protein